MSSNQREDGRVCATNPIFKCLSEALFGTKKHEKVIRKILAAHLKQNWKVLYPHWIYIGGYQLASDSSAKISSGDIYWPIAVSVAANLFGKTIKVMTLGEKEEIFGPMCENPIVIFIHTEVLSGLSSFKLIQREEFSAVAMNRSNKVQHLTEPNWEIRTNATASAACEPPLTAAPLPPTFHVETNVGSRITFREEQPGSEATKMATSSVSRNLRPCSEARRVSATRREASTAERRGSHKTSQAGRCQLIVPLTTAQVTERARSGSSGPPQRPLSPSLSRGECPAKGGSGEGDMSAPHPPRHQEDTREEVTTPGRRPSYPEMDAVGESEPWTQGDDQVQAANTMSGVHEAPSPSTKSRATNSDQFSAVCENQVFHKFQNLNGKDASSAKFTEKCSECEAKSENIRARGCSMQPCNSSKFSKTFEKKESEKSQLNDGQKLVCEILREIFIDNNKPSIWEYHRRWLDLSEIDPKLWCYVSLTALIPELVARRPKRYRKCEKIFKARQNKVFNPVVENPSDYSLYGSEFYEARKLNIVERYVRDMCDSEIDSESESE